MGKLKAEPTTHSPLRRTFLFLASKNFEGIYFKKLRFNNFATSSWLKMQLVNMGEMRAKGLRDIVQRYTPDLTPFEERYKDLHKNPELGKQECRTASIAEEHLKSLGFEVHARIGGYGLAGILKNGPGCVVLLRADMDALPIKEETGLSYASRVEQKNEAGETVPVMHACGHDMNTSCMMAVATLLKNAQAEWSGTLICLFQPNEETGAGAQSMVNGGLYDLVPVPHIILGQHVDYRRTGNVAIRPGIFMATADSFVVTIYGRGGHGSQPQFCVDPILISSYIIVRLQSIVSRMVAPLDTAVVTCGSIHAGSGENSIPDSAELKINVRTYDPTTRESVLKALKDIIRAECASAGAPREPDIKPTTQFPLTENDEHLADLLKESFVDFFGEAKVEVMEKLAGSEDVSNLARPNKTPYAFWFWGGTDADKWDDAEKNGLLQLIPRNHSSKFGPVIQPTMSSGIQALSLAALRFLT
jgi:amidohydrolase